MAESLSDLDRIPDFSQFMADEPPSTPSRTKQQEEKVAEIAARIHPAKAGDSLPFDLMDGHDRVLIKEGYLHKQGANLSLTFQNWMKAHFIIYTNGNCWCKPVFLLPGMASTVKRVNTRYCFLFNDVFVLTDQKSEKDTSLVYKNAVDLKT